jgi:hypothetical protein
MVAGSAMGTSFRRHPQRPLGDHEQPQIRCPLAADAGRDLGTQESADGIEAGFDGPQIGVVGCDERHEQGGTAGFWADVEDPQALEVGIGQVAGENEVDALMGLPAQLSELSIRFG